jgi:hypothetical protein
MKDNSSITGKTVANAFSKIIEGKIDQETRDDIINILDDIAREENYAEVFYYILTNDENIFDKLSDRDKELIEDLKTYKVLVDENNNKFIICN